MDKTCGLFVTTLLLLGISNLVYSTPLWAIIRVWPVPMPVHANSPILPLFLSTSCAMDLPCVKPVDFNVQVYNATAFSLNSALCFVTMGKAQTPCITLSIRTLSNWMDPVNLGGAGSGVLGAALTQVAGGETSGAGSMGTNATAFLNITTFLLKSNVTVPRKLNQHIKNATVRRILPWCPPDQSFPQVFTSCQGWVTSDVELSPGFTLVPPLKRNYLALLVMQQVDLMSGRFISRF